jgi:hypothetical protein
MCSTSDMATTPGGQGPCYIRGGTFIRLDSPGFEPGAFPVPGG